ncbi:MAG: tRNA (adenosine(37)-N6)-threonylcarbamoyltransferase complex ATPase subunit type 1 TsaE [Candidatus Omnitrophota bacterium]|nr:tRNA (adenosine(37)-N6)-threonylcarbamoyltransferase complex ATPase subunit type 1 TsaE [Candidatus Omnitrophota bacterium]
MVKVLTNSAKETVALGKKFSKILKEKDVVLFEGALGGGKTTFIKGILRGFNLKAKALSPSFTLVRRYHKRRLYIYHIDLYRLDNADVFSFGIEDYLYAPGVIVLVEWGEKFEKHLSRYIKAEFSFLGESARKISFSYKGYSNKIFSSIRKTQ